MSVTVYVIRSRERDTYVGITDDLTRRLHEHNAGYSRYTRKGADWEVIYSEEVSNRREARNREKYLKSHAGKDWLQRQELPTVPRDKKLLLASQVAVY
ncbi:MAG: GIY-YIG nuclease family protein [Candidatus Neomarinimicrobiota bacterium]